MQKISREEVKRQQEQNRLAAENAKLRADLDYIQIMTGVEIPTDEEGGGAVNERMV